MCFSFVNLKKKNLIQKNPLFFLLYGRLLLTSQIANTTWSWNYYCLCKREIMMQLLIFTATNNHISYIHLSYLKVSYYFFQYRSSLHIYYLKIDKTTDKTKSWPSILRKLSSLKVVSLKTAFGTTCASRYFAKQYIFCIKCITCEIKV